MQRWLPTCRAGLRALSELLFAGVVAAAPALADDAGLLFRVSADHGLAADFAGGVVEPNFQHHAEVVPGGRSGSAIQWADDGYVTWLAPGNMYAQRGTLSFFWRPREPLGEAPFVLFRVGFADHSSWDMAFLRIDWNGLGFDAFVTDANLARLRVSFPLKERPAADAWLHLAFAWDERVGVRLYLNGREVARLDQAADLDSGLDQFGLAGRIIAPHQVQSRYNFMRGSDFDEIRVYDRILDASDVGALASLSEPGRAATATESWSVAYEREWLARFGWDGGRRPPLLDGATRIRKIEVADARDLKEWMWKGVDGIAETTWPGVYNRSRLPGRDDYFELPDWNVYVEGGRAYELTLPEEESFNRVEIRGAAFGSLDYAADGRSYRSLATRERNRLRTVDEFERHRGGTLRFTNTEPETPIQEFWIYDVRPGVEPQGTRRLSYTVRADVAPDFAALASLNTYIAGRYPAVERATVVALPGGGTRARAPLGAGRAAAGSTATREGRYAPLVHVLIPSGFGDAYAARPVTRAWNYGWENAHDGLDGIAIDLPALAGGGPSGTRPIALDLRVKDPIWPGRDTMDVSFSVRPGEPATVWLDLRDRILTNDSFYLTVASSEPSFGPASLDGMRIRLVFKDRDAAVAEHVADRFNQVRDNWGFLVEEHTASKRAALYRRLFADVSDLLRVAPDHLEGRRYWADISYRAMGFPPFEQPAAPDGVPTWAFRQLEDLRLVRQFVMWWIENRQVPYGDFGGGISDDTDLTQQWPGLALIGVEPERVNRSLRALSDAVYANGMIVNGLGYVTTDELHAYEEGLNSDAQRLYLNWGEPRTVERLMATTRALRGVILRNPAGHVHFSSNWYGGRKVYREGPWEWQKPYSFTVLHAPILLGVFNGSPLARGLVTNVVDGWMAHGRQDAAGLWTYANEINWRTDAERQGDGGGLWTPMQAAWAAWRFTGDEAYLRPIVARVAARGPGSLDDLNENVVEVLGRGVDWGAKLVEDAGEGGDFERYAAWDRTGDLSWLEQLHADSIGLKSNRMYMHTEGHWWSDRVEQSSELLQRERLGGIALWRNQTYPGATVSWRFVTPGAAEQVAILLPRARPDRFKVVAYNSSDRSQRAEMTTWNVVAGRWRVTGPGRSPREITLERSASLPLEFEPGVETTLEFDLVEPGTLTESRPDLGIGDDDVAVSGREVQVTVHSLGARDAQDGQVLLEGVGGRVVATAPVPKLDAPLDLLPRTATVALRAPDGLEGEYRIRVALPAGAQEVTQLNNSVAVRLGAH